MDQSFYKTHLEEKKQRKGRILENIIYLELLRNEYSVTVGTFKDYEVDFVARKNDKKVYLKVSYNLSNDKTLDREIRPFLSIQDNYPKLLIIMGREDYSNMRIKHYNAIKFLKDINNIEKEVLN